jgi:hypothetical protein
MFYLGERRMRIQINNKSGISEISYVKGTKKDIEILSKFIMNNKEIIKRIEITEK